MMIRPYRPSDEAAVIALWSECGLVVPQNHPVRDIARKLAVDPDRFLVGEDAGGRLVATCMAGYDGHRGAINYLAVAPDVRGRGYGRAILGCAERALRAAGCAKINLMVRSTNRGVMAFYRRMGYADDPVACMGKRLESDPPFAPGRDGGGGGDAAGG